MSIRAIRLCHHCAVPLEEDECLFYAFECHACVMTEHELDLAVRRDPAHPEAHRLANGPVEIRRALRVAVVTLVSSRAPTNERAA